MAHHARTPQTVLDAPSRTVVVSHAPLGATRQERRHGVSIPPDLGAQGAALYLAKLGRARNAPAARVSPRRGRKVRRAGQAS